MIKFWPFPLVRRHKTSKVLSDLFIKFAEAEEFLLLEADWPKLYTISITTEHGNISFWTSSDYAYGDSGTLTTAGTSVQWKDAMPSRYANRLMQKRIEEFNKQHSFETKMKEIM